MAVLEVENGVRSLFIFPDISSGFQCARNRAMAYERNAGLPSTFMPWDLASMRRRRVLACARWGSYLPFVRFLFNSSEILPELRLRTRAISRMPYCFSRKSAISRRSVLLIFGLLCIHYGLYRSVRIQNGMDAPVVPWRRREENIKAHTSNSEVSRGGLIRQTPFCFAQFYQGYFNTLERIKVTYEEICLKFHFKQTDGDRPAGTADGYGLLTACGHSCYDSRNPQ